MEIVIRAAAAAVIGSILALLLRKYTPELSLTVTILAGVIIVWLAAAVASRISDLLREIAEKGGIDAVYLSPVLKCIGIGMITHLAAQVCRDAGENGIASKVEMAGKIFIFYAALPVFTSLIRMLQMLLEI